MNAVTNTSPALEAFLARADKNEAAAILRAEGLPQRRVEAWRYTPLRAVSETAYAAAPQLDEERVKALLEELALEATGARVVFANGRYVSALSNIPEGVEVLVAYEEAKHQQPIAYLNQALREPGLRLRVPKDVDAGRLALISLSEGEEAFSTHLHHHIILDEGAKLTLLDIQAGHGNYLSNPVFDVTVGDYAALIHVKVQQEDRKAAHLALVSADVAQHGTYDSFMLTLGAALARHEVLARLNGVHANVHVNAAQLLGDRQHADLTSVITHDAPDCNSRQTVKNVLLDEAHGVFQGKIYVDRIAQKTDGYQMNQALLLSEKAQIDSKPELEIYADDVKCSHGATVGALDDEQLFYLQSRGIPLAQARAMLVRAFMIDALALVQDEALHDILDRRVETWWEGRQS
ncbi:Fe-S cluster assembly protein SufD [Kozakia baliensis]|uniref:ABC transporter permease n=1 Tax=Kozakia baliensis TaxID=153496 RepID=A0A1D8UTX4_9PROT|nr:Fe-S cluster assembly protein SufD [Kozakia baliensis]AOX17089.1 ABC transporter permease [Kozakia baliensis]GBR24897.1 iron-sulfur assembly protein SufD [Kozakia baliensis NRIC 0488]GEL63841.1 Fe-S cluster assembly protein SufD [Kozakia baliensis]